jgi:hypothetical protein
MQNAIWPSSILYFPSSLVPALPRRTVDGGGLGPALNHENYETNPKELLCILLKYNDFDHFWWFFCRRKNPKVRASLAQTPGFPPPPPDQNCSAPAPV